MKRSLVTKLAAIMLGLSMAVGVAATVQASQPPGQLGYEGQPGNQGGASGQPGK